SSRGFFFSHVGWLLFRKHPSVIAAGRKLDLADLEADPIVMFQRRHYIPMMLLFWGALPTVIPVLCWSESWSNALLVCVFFRYAYGINMAFLVNSWSHLYGNRPYDSRIAPVESSIRHLVAGEGFHNYHHAY